MKTADMTEQHLGKVHEKPARHRGILGEASLFLAGTIFTAALVLAGPVFAEEARYEQLAALPEKDDRSKGLDELDLSLDTTKASRATSASERTPFERASEDKGVVTNLSSQTSIHGIHYLQIDLYGDDMRPRGGKPLP